METILADLTTSISEFKQNPSASVKAADGKPFAVLINNVPAFYVLTPAEYDRMLEIEWEKSIAPELSKRLADDSAENIRVDLGELKKGGQIRATYSNSTHSPKRNGTA